MVNSDFCAATVPRVEKWCLTLACKVTEQRASGVLGGLSLRVILMRSVCNTLWQQQRVMH